MNIRQARKIMCGHISKRLRDHLHKLYPPIEIDGRTTYPSWHNYHRIRKAYIIVFRKVRKYGDNFKKL